MGKVAKYNLFKAISLVLTAGSPIIALACCSDLFVHRSDTAVSAAGMFAIFIAAFIFKDKLAENFKVPPTFVIAGVGLVLVVMIERLLLPIKLVCIITIVTSLIDEVSFKQICKHMDMTLPEETKLYKKAGFIFTTSKRLLGTEESNET